MTSHRTLLLASLLVLVTSCSSAADVAPVVQAQSAPSSSRSWSGSYGGDIAAPDVTPLERALQGGITVPPDRGLAMIEAHIRADGREHAMRRIRHVSDALAAISQTREGCTLEPWSFGAIQRSDDAYSASATLRLDVDLTSAGSLEERQEHIEACLGALDALDPARFQDVTVRRSELVLTIDDPAQHRGALLEQRMASLHAVAMHGGAPPQFQPDALRCTSSGEVRIESRSLRGIDLAVDFACAPTP